MESLREAGLEDSAHEAVSSGRPFLGICIGMQMLFDASEEDPAVKGLGVIHGSVCWIPPGVKRPPMQWNRLVLTQPDDPLFVYLRDCKTWMYFVHSLHGVPDDPTVVAATCDYGGTLNAAFRQDNVFATQFHPEKSGRRDCSSAATSPVWPPGHFARWTCIPPSTCAADVFASSTGRLLEGDHLRRRPVAMAQSFAAAGARWIHVVDLDAARSVIR